MPAPAATDARQPLLRGVALLQQGKFREAENLIQDILLRQPANFEALQLLGVIALQTGRVDRSVGLIAKAIKINPSVPAAHCNMAAALLRLGRHADAVASYGKAIALKPDFAEAYNDRGNALRQLRRLDEALASCDQAIAIRPGFAEAYDDRGTILQELGRYGEAIASHDKAIALQPGFGEAHINRGNALRSLRRFDEALASYDRAIALRPGFAEAYVNRGNVLRDLKRLDRALASHDTAIVLRPGFAEAYINRGSALRDLKRLDEALASYERAIALKPDYAEAYSNRGKVLWDLRRLDEALASYATAIALKPDYADAYNNRGNTLRDLDRLGEALASYDKAIALWPDYAEAHSNRGGALAELKRYEEALSSYAAALRIEPDLAAARMGIWPVAQAICDWRLIAEHVGVVTDNTVRAVTPFVLLVHCDDPAAHLQCAAHFIGEKLPTLPQPLWSGTARRHDKIRVAYLSADFRDHAVAHLIAGLIEAHDRSHFEVIGVSLGVDDQSAMRRRLAGSFDQFHSVRTESNLAVASLMHRLEIDVAVDLLGYTRDARPEILAHRPAPIQVNYLGYPGTMAARFIDYVIADPIVLPFDQQPFYTEKIVHLPECYQVNDAKRTIGEHTPSRTEAGLPEHGFVFCCFNNNFKINAAVFEIWMRLLHSVTGSVLWLLRDNAMAERNLLGAAAAHGINPARLVFADRVPLDQHLARHRLADLFLDTLPYNAHTTASDALWVGLPILTCQGHAFAGRVAASLLHAVGLPDLVTSDLHAYETLALRLATDATLLNGLRDRLAQNRLTCPLFDTDRSRRHIEKAYLTMLDLWQQGESPRSFSIAPD
jgi:predicted O-linked N-acetylglucosamine transferase (SPINDLY family)